MKDIIMGTMTPMLYMFLCIIIGYILYKKNVLPDNTATVLSKLEVWLFTPALNLKTFIVNCTVKSLYENMYFISYSVIIMGIAVVIATILGKLFSKDKTEQGIYRYSLAFANYGFMGTAVAPLILGEKYLYLYMMFSIPLQITTYIWGYANLIPKGKMGKSILSNLLNPPCISVFVGIVIGCLGCKDYVPEAVMLTLDGIGSCMGPVAMVIAGFVIAKYDMFKLFKNKNVYIVSLLRLILLPFIYCTFLHFCDANMDVIKITMIAYGVSLGLNTVVVPEAYGGNTETGASMAIISNIFCVVTLPILYMMILSVVQ